MTDFTLSPSEDDVFKALGDFLQDILPPQDDAADPVVKFIVVAGQENRVPEPKEPNYIVFIPLRMPRLATNFEELAGAGLQRGLVRSVKQNTEVVFQLDVHGPQAFNNANRISTLFRSSYATDYFEGKGMPIAPLFADDPRQAQFVDGEKQYEDRYIVEAHLQVNFTMTAVAQSARTLTVEIIDVETPPASWPNGIATATGS